MKPITREVATEYRFAGRNERAVGRNGELNASSRKEALHAANSLMLAHARGEVVTETQFTAEKSRQVLIAAKGDKNLQREVGEKIAEEIYMTSNRKGNMRRFLARQDLKQGEIPRFKVSLKNVQAFVYTSPSRIESRMATDNYLTPPEVQIVARPFIPQNELNQSPNNVLEEKYVEGLEGIMVQEDRMWANLARATIGQSNNRTSIVGTMTPLSLMNVRQNVARWGMKVAYMYMASDLFVDIVGDSSFINAIEPVARHELVMTGELGVLYGMTIISEAYRHPEHKVLSQGEFMCVADKQFHGAYSDRGGVDSMPTNATTEDVIGMGWILSESVAMSIANDRSVAIAVRT